MTTPITDPDALARLTRTLRHLADGIERGDMAATYCALGCQDASAGHWLTIGRGQHRLEIDFTVHEES